MLQSSQQQNSSQKNSNFMGKIGVILKKLQLQDLQNPYQQQQQHKPFEGRLYRNNNEIVNDELQSPELFTKENENVLQTQQKEQQQYQFDLKESQLHRLKQIVRSRLNKQQYKHLKEYYEQKELRNQKQQQNNQFFEEKDDYKSNFQEDSQYDQVINEGSKGGKKLKEKEQQLKEKLKESLQTDDKSQQQKPRYNQRRILKVWIKEEDQLLLYYYNKFKGKWDQISEEIPYRNSSQCAQRYRRLNPQRVRTHWSNEQDNQVKKMVNKFGKNWGLIASSLEGRTGKQVRERYINCLDPIINKSNFEKKEDKLIIDFYKKRGPKWSELSKRLKGRPENMIKNRYYAHLKRLEDNGPSSYLKEIEELSFQSFDEFVELAKKELQNNDSQEKKLKKSKKTQKDDKDQSHQNNQNNEIFNQLNETNLLNHNDSLVNKISTFSFNNNLIGIQKKKKKKQINLNKQKKLKNNKQKNCFQGENLEISNDNNFTPIFQLQQITKQNDTEQNIIKNNNIVDYQTQNNISIKNIFNCTQKNKDNNSQPGDNQNDTKYQNDEEKKLKSFSSLMGPYSSAKSPCNKFQQGGNFQLTPNPNSCDYFFNTLQNNEIPRFFNFDAFPLQTPDLNQSCGKSMNIFSFNENENSISSNNNEIIDNKCIQQSPYQIVPDQVFLQQQQQLKQQQQQSSQQQNLDYQQQIIQQTQQQPILCSKSFNNGIPPTTTNTPKMNSSTTTGHLSINSNGIYNNDIKKNIFQFSNQNLNSGYLSPIYNYISPQSYQNQLSSTSINNNNVTNWANLNQNSFSLQNNNSQQKELFKQPEIKDDIRNKIKKYQNFNHQNNDNQYNNYQKISSREKNQNLSISNKNSVKKKDFKIIVNSNENKDTM